MTDNDRNATSGVPSAGATPSASLALAVAHQGDEVVTIEGLGCPGLVTLDKLN